jgi:hypothetical protein
MRWVAARTQQTPVADQHGLAGGGDAAADALADPRPRRSEHLLDELAAGRIGLEERR